MDAAEPDEYSALEPDEPIIINSSRWVYDGSYIKLKNIALTYHFPHTWFGARN
jgi:hypothetical protein